MTLETQSRYSLRTVAAHGAHHASQALSKWFGRSVRVTTEGFESVPLTAINTAIGDPDSIVVAMRMGIIGQITGEILITVPDHVACMLCDVMMMREPGDTTELGEMEISCLQETANILGSSFTNSLSTWLNLSTEPTSPIVIRDLACAVVQPVLTEQAEFSDEVLLTRCDFLMDRLWLEWGLYLLPSPQSQRLIEHQCQREETESAENALNIVAVNGAFAASRALSKWFKLGVRLKTEGFTEVPITEVGSIVGTDDEEIAALHLLVTGDFSGQILIAFPTHVAMALIDLLTGQPLETTQTIDELGQSCLQETANIVGSAYINSFSNWLGLYAAPLAPVYQYDLACALIDPLLAEQAAVADTILLSRTDFLLDGHWLDWTFLMIPAPDVMSIIRARS